MEVRAGGSTWGGFAIRAGDVAISVDATILQRNPDRGRESDDGEATFRQHENMVLAVAARIAAHDAPLRVYFPCVGSNGGRDIDGRELAVREQKAMHFSSIRRAWRRYRRAKTSDDLTLGVDAQRIGEGGAGGIDRGELAVTQQKSMPDSRSVGRKPVHSHDIAAGVYAGRHGEYGAGKINRVELAPLSSQKAVCVAVSRAHVPPDNVTGSIDIESRRGGRIGKINHGNVRLATGPIRLGADAPMVPAGSLARAEVEQSLNRQPPGDLLKNTGASGKEGIALARLVHVWTDRRQDDFRECMERARGADELMIDRAMKRPVVFDTDDLEIRAKQNSLEIAGQDALKRVRAGRMA